MLHGDACCRLSDSFYISGCRSVLVQADGCSQSTQCFDCQSNVAPGCFSWDLCCVYLLLQGGQVSKNVWSDPLPVG